MFFVDNPAKGNKYYRQNSCLEAKYWRKMPLFSAENAKNVIPSNSSLHTAPNPNET